MRIDNPRTVLFLSLVLALVLVGCPGGTGTSTGEDSDTDAAEAPAPTAEEIEAAEAVVAASAGAARAALVDMTFEEYEATVYKEPFEGGKYIVNGDTTIADIKHLREFFNALQMMATPVAEGEIRPEPQASLVVHQEGGVDSVWDSGTKGSLTYCVSDTFGANKASVVADMATATAEWEAAANVDFVHATDQDANCNRFNPNVVFDVRPVNVNGRYLARAFFPHESRISRNILIDDSSFELDPSPPAKLNLKGILAHELGHCLGFRHEHTRPDARKCFEDTDWRPLTSYDAFSVMHYPQCNGLGDWSLTLTHKDNNGAACLYGPADGFTVDTSICTPPVPDDVEPAVEQTETVTGLSVGAGDRTQFGPFAVAPGTVFTATMSGSGDPDLYVRWGLAPTRTNYNCRPFLFGADETCALDVPAGESEAFVMVHGFEAGSYDLAIQHTPAAE